MTDEREEVIARGELALEADRCLACQGTGQFVLLDDDLRATDKTAPCAACNGAGVCAPESLDSRTSRFLEMLDKRLVSKASFLRVYSGSPPSDPGKPVADINLLVEIPFPAKHIKVSLKLDDDVEVDDV